MTLLLTAMAGSGESWKVTRNHTRGIYIASDVVLRSFIGALGNFIVGTFRMIKDSRLGIVT